MYYNISLKHEILSKVIPTQELWPETIKYKKDVTSTIIISAKESYRDLNMYECMYESYVWESNLQVVLVDCYVQ